jgi:hypothetical protein
MVLNGEYVRIWTVVSAAYFKVLSLHARGMTAKNHEKAQSR